MRSALALLAALTLVTACGGSDVGAGESSSAGLLKPGAIVYWQTVADPDSEQWEQAEELLRRFPDGEQWIARLEQELSQEGVSWENDVRPALGSVVDVVVYVDGGEPAVVGLTKPEDMGRFDALVQKLNENADEPVVTREVGDWVAVAQTDQALEAALKEDGGDALADDESFRSALEELPEDSLSRVYVDPASAIDVAGAGLDRGTLRMLGLENLDFAGAWAKAKEEGAELSVTLRGAGVDGLFGAGDPYASKLLDYVPDDAFAFVTFRGTGLAGQLQALRGNPLFELGIRRFERETGIDVDDLASLLDGELAFFVQPGAPTAAFTLLLESDDPAAARPQLDRLLRSLADDFEFRVTTPAADVVAVTTSAIPFDPPGAGDKLADSDRYSEALDAAAAPDEYTGLAYVDLRRTIAAVLAAVGMSGEDVPAVVRRNLEALDTLVGYGTKDGGSASARVFVGID